MTVICAQCGIDEPHRGHYVGCPIPLADKGEPVSVYPDCPLNTERDED